MRHPLFAFLIRRLRLFGSISASLGFIAVFPLRSPSARSDEPRLVDFIAIGTPGVNERWTATNRGTFRAVMVKEWPVGLIPLFPVEKSSGIELRLLPGAGQENFAEPLCFVAGEPSRTNAATGRWRILATGSLNRRHSVLLELFGDGEKLAGRFDQTTDYRFARIDNAVFRTNRLSLEVTYIMDQFTMSGMLMNGFFTGSWTNLNGSDGGTWTGTPIEPGPALEGSPPPRRPLHEWRNAIVPRRRYGPADAITDPDWKRVDPPMAWVW